MIDWAYRARSDLPSKIGRRINRWRNAVPTSISCPEPIVTVTFDDFPKSALNGADIVESSGGKAGFYACTSMAGHNGPYGEMFDTETLTDLQSRGHEIGSHTDTHLDMSLTGADDALSDIDRNLKTLKDMGLEAEVKSFAYPFGETRFATRTELSKRFQTCRGVAPGANMGTVDRSHLRAFELNADKRKLHNAVAALETLSDVPSWIILFTHDVSQDPSDFGVSIQDLKELCARAVDVGAKLMTPSAAANLVGIKNV